MRDALRRQLSLLHFEQARRKVLPFAEARGYRSDEDVFKDMPQHLQRQRRQMEEEG